MNKKTLIIIACVLVAIAVIVVAIFATSGKTEKITLKDNDNEGYTVELGYQKKSGITIENEQDTVTIKNEAENYEFSIWLSVDSTYEDNKEYAKDDESEYKDVKFANYEGYVTHEYPYQVEGAILLEGNDEDNQYKYLTFIVEAIDTYKDDEEVNIYPVYESKFIQSILKSIKYSKSTQVANTDDNDDNNYSKTKNYGEFASRTDGISDKDGLIFIPSFESPDIEKYTPAQANDNVGIDNYLWYKDENSAYTDSGIEVRIFPKKDSYESMDEYIKEKGDMYHWSKTTIAGKEYDTFEFGTDPVKPAKYSDYYSGAFMVGNKVIEFSYNMFAEVPDQDLGQQFFKQIVDSIEYASDYKE